MGRGGGGGTPLCAGDGVTRRWEGRSPIRTAGANGFGVPGSPARGSGLRSPHGSGETGSARVAFGSFLGC